MPSLAGLSCWRGRIQSWPQLGLQWGSCRSAQGPWGSCGVPRESTSTPRAGETGAELSHRVGIGAAQRTKHRGEDGAGAGQGGHGCPEPRLSFTPLCSQQEWASRDAALPGILGSPVLLGTQGLLV